jgi:hypothetical protein
MTDREELRRCKPIESNKYLCKQTRPLLNSHMQETCAIVTSTKNKYSKGLRHSNCATYAHDLDTEQRNEWIYFSPVSDSITILCPDKEPLDVLLTGTGKLIIQPNCKQHIQHICSCIPHLGSMLYSSSRTGWLGRAVPLGDSAG